MPGNDQNILYKNPIYLLHFPRKSYLELELLLLFDILK